MSHPTVVVEQMHTSTFNLNHESDAPGSHCIAEYCSVQHAARGIGNTSTKQPVLGLLIIFTQAQIV